MMPETSLEFRMKHLLIGLAFAVALTAGFSSASFAESVSDVNSRSVLVTVDQAKVFRVSRPAGTIIIGNPAIVDATIQDDQTLILTGRSFGVTNLIVLDANGNQLSDGDTVIVNRTLPVKGAPKPIKPGTKVKNIRLKEGDHNIDCKIDGFGSMALKSEFVTKA